jgi:hypothetical protein
MKREQLTALVASAASALGYAFHTGETHLASSTVRVYPAVWLSPLALRSRSGRSEGETTWRLTLHLMALPTEPQVEALWQTLEDDACRIARTLAASGAVCAVENISCAPAQRSLTTHGEISLALTCDVTMWYYA